MRNNTFSFACLPSDGTHGDIDDLIFSDLDYQTSQR